MSKCKFLTHLNPFEKSGAGTQNSLAQEVERDLSGEPLPNVMFADPVQRRQNFCHTYCASASIANMPLMYCDWATNPGGSKWDPSYFLCYYPCKAAGSVKNFLMGKPKDKQNQGAGDNPNQTKYSPGSGQLPNVATPDSLDAYKGQRQSQQQNHRQTSRNQL